MTAAGYLAPFMCVSVCLCVCTREWQMCSLWCDVSSKYTHLPTTDSCQPQQRADACRLSASTSPRRQPPKGQRLSCRSSRLRVGNVIWCYYMLYCVIICYYCVIICYYMLLLCYICCYCVITCYYCVITYIVGTSVRSVCVWEWERTTRSDERRECTCNFSPEVLMSSL